MKEKEKEIEIKRGSERSNRKIKRDKGKTKRKIKRDQYIQKARERLFRHFPLPKPPYHLQGGFICNLYKYRLNKRSNKKIRGWSTIACSRQTDVITYVASLNHAPDAFGKIDIV